MRARRLFALSLLAIAVPLSVAPGQRLGNAQQRQLKLDTSRVAGDPQLREALEHRQLATWDQRERTIPFVMSASGGISLGAYQAGVTWALGRFMRQLERDSVFRDSVGVGTPYFAAATGASAGNINALLSAIEWCTPEPTLPEESLFWKIWISVGWPELFPEHRSRFFDIRQAGHSGGAAQADAGVFDRTFFRTSLFPAVESRMLGATRPICDGFPIGVTATRLEPTAFPVTDQLSAVTQRYAATFELRDNPGQPQGLVFAQPRLALRDRGMGALLALAVGETNVIPSIDLFTLIEASSAFPVAFSPRIIRYYEADSLAEDGVCPHSVVGTQPCKPPREAYFTDGGVFDNNPLQLALDIHERTTRTVVVKNDEFDAPLTRFAMVPARALYVGMDQYRGDLLRVQRSAISDTQQPVGGLGAVVQLLSGAVPAARQYEMQTLARSLARDRVMPREFIRVTDRYFPLFGEQLGAFGAFLGRPMREWDFYAGVYDGLHFAASDVICSRDGAVLRRFGGVSEQDRCTAQYLARLAGGRVFPLGAIGAYVLADMYKQEREQKLDPVDDMPSHLERRDAERLRVLRGLTVVQRKQLYRTGKSACDTKDWARALLCGGHLDSLMFDIKHDEPLFHTLERWSDEKQCDQASTLETPCLADDSFVSLVNDPAGEFKHRVGHVSTRLWRQEEDVRDRNKKARAGMRKTKEYSSWVEFAEFVLRSYDWPARRGVDLDPSSIPPEGADKTKRFLTSLLPYHLSGGIGIAGFEAGWTPLIHVGERWALQFPQGVMNMRETYLREESPTPRRLYLVSGAGFLYKPGGLVIPGIGLAARPILGSTRFKHRSIKATRVPLDLVSAELSIYALAGKLRLSVYTVPPGIEARKKYGVRAGVADLPGILYWIWR